MTAIKRIKAGGQIYNDFGELPRSDLLRRYGFVTARYEKWDVVELPLNLIVEVCNILNPLDEKSKENRVSFCCAVMTPY